MISHSVRAQDGRILSVGEGGEPRGKPIFALHGTPGSTMVAGDEDEDAKRKGIRLISYDRPGYGGSTPQPGRKVADAAKDVATIADALGLDRFAVWGISGGGPHALACASLISDRLVAAASLASVAPYPAPGIDWFAGQGEDNVAEFKAALAGPEILRKFIGPIREQLMTASADDMAQVMESLLPPVDKAIFSGEFGGFIADNIKAGIAPGYSGWEEDDLAFVSDWGFKPSDVSTPLLLWQGRQDKMVPFAHGEWLAARIKGAEVHLSDEDGHLTLYQRRVPETHAWLLKHF